MSSKFKWQTDLLLLQNKHLSNLIISKHSDIDQVLTVFKENYPGNYHLEWRYDISLGYMILYPIFEHEHEHEETFWKLKYSN